MMGAVRPFSLRFPFCSHSEPFIMCHVKSIFHLLPISAFISCDICIWTGFFIVLISFASGFLVDIVSVVSKVRQWVSFEVLTCYIAERMRRVRGGWDKEELWEFITPGAVDSYLLPTPRLAVLHPSCNHGISLQHRNVLGR